MDDALPIVALRWLLYADLMTLWGVSLFTLYGLTAAERARRVGPDYTRLLVSTAMAGLILSITGLAWLGKEMTGAPCWADVTMSTYLVLVADTAMGWAWQVRMVAILVAMTAALAGRGVIRHGIVAVAAAAALASLAWTGHGAMDTGLRNVVHLTADIIHLWAAGAWWGALVAFVLLAHNARARVPASVNLLSRAAHGFARVGSLIVALLVVSGVINYVLTAGLTWTPLLDTRYGHLLLAKLSVFGAMLGLAGMNRYRLSPALALAQQRGDTTQAVRLLQRSLLVETGAAGALLGIVAWLGTLSPLP